ncbi:endonuclease/exonuclease/phosphatase family protein [Streptomyces anulatus]|uniref:endonuclease/exonuclease/phosphatase family protein n=1 Tax=Streptomyces anulatus TaxID=1892 RepID=UPI003417687B
MNSQSNEVLCFGFLNLEVDGGPDEEPGYTPVRWREAHEFLASRELDWLGRAEMTYSQTSPAPADATEAEKTVVEAKRVAADRRFRVAQTVLGMKGFRGTTGQGGNPTGMFVRESTFEVVSRQEHLAVWRTPPTNVRLRLLDGPPTPIETVAWHNSFCSPNVRENEAEELSALVDKVQAKHGADPDRNWSAFLGAGDCNEYPMPAGETVPPIDWEHPEITDLVHRRHRARKRDDGTWASCTYLDELMLDAGMWDPARFAAHCIGHSGPLSATAGRGTVGQGGDQRIDRFYMDPWTVLAVLAVDVISMAGISDHDYVEVLVERRAYEEALARKSNPMEPWGPGRVRT